MYRMAGGSGIAAAGWDTRLNGKSVQDSTLVDGDVLQIGSFSFHLNLPGKSAHGTSLRPETNVPPSDKTLTRLQTLRRHLAELALNLRRRCRDIRITREACSKPRIG